MNKVVAFALLTLALGGCATQPLNFTPANVAPVANKIDAQIMNVNVGLDSTTGSTFKKKRLDAGGFEAQLQQLWKSSLEDTLARSAVFNDNSARRVNLSVTIVRLALPKGAVVMHTGTVARYDIIDRATGKVVYSSEIESDGRVSGDYAFMGATRARESVNRSVQNNISEFVNRLNSANLTQ